MSQKPRRGKGNPHPNHKNDEGNNESTKRHVYVEPGAKIDLVDDLKSQLQTDETKRQSQQDGQLFWTKITTILLFLTAGFSGWQGCSTRVAANAAKDAANTASKNLAFAQQQFRVDERAWLEPIFSYDDKKRLTDTSGMSLADITIYNAGQTQASSVHGFIVAVSIPQNAKNIPFDVADTFPHTSGVIYSKQSSQSFQVPIVWQLPNGDWNTIPWNIVDQQVKESGLVFGFGKVIYKDIFGPETHVVTFCQALRGTFRIRIGDDNPPLAQECSDYNRTYDEK